MFKAGNQEMRKINCTLLVDDDTITNFINQRLITKMAIAQKVTTVNNGKQALEYVTEYCSLTNGCCPDLILLDIKMPVMDGFEFLNAYNALDFCNKRRIVIVMLSTSSDPGDLDRIKKYEIGEFITKPLTEEKLMGVYNKYFADLI